MWHCAGGEPRRRRGCKANGRLSHPFLLNVLAESIYPGSWIRMSLPEHYLGKHDGMCDIDMVEGVACKRPSATWFGFLFDICQEDEDAEPFACVICLWKHFADDGSFEWMFPSKVRDAICRDVCLHWVHSIARVSYHGNPLNHPGAFLLHHSINLVVIVVLQIWLQHRAAQTLDQAIVCSSRARLRGVGTSSLFCRRLMPIFRVVCAIHGPCHS